MNWHSDRMETIRELEREARSSGSFVDRAIVREIRIASALFSATESAWAEVVKLAESWENGMPDLEVLDAIRRVNRTASCWKTAAEKTPSAEGQP